MARNKVILYDGPMDYLLNNPNGPTGRVLRKKGSYVLKAAKAQVGVRTGALKQSIHQRHLRDSRGQYVRIGSDKPYALAHHEGTRPHRITPNRAQALKFTARGAVIYAGVVNHPGTKANKYLTDNLHLIKLPT